MANKNKQLNFYLRPAKLIQQLPVTVNTISQPLIPGERLYLPDNPIINSMVTIGILAYSTQIAGISNTVAKPQPGINVGALAFDDYLTLTLCDKNGVELIKNMPYKGLANAEKKYNPVLLKVNTRRSYFKLNNAAPALGSNLVANIVFYLRDLNE